MKPIIKWTMSIVCILALTACGSRSKHVSLEKDGTKYAIGNDVSFYYPNDFSLDTSRHYDVIAPKGSNTLRFIKDDETIFYTVIEDKTDNSNDDKDELYTAQLEQEGASNIVVSRPILQSGITVFEITGNYNTTGMRFKHIAYFKDEHSYVFGYFATIDDYNDHIDTVTEFLHSIAIDDTPTT